jgi:hypothetical protein
LLQAVVRRDITDIGHRDRYDPTGGCAGGKARQRELRQGRDRPADGHQDGADNAGKRHGAVFAEAVADRTDNELDRAVRHRVGGDHHGRYADGGMQIGRHLRQQRVHHADLGLAGKARDSQQNDGARRVRSRGCWERKHRGVRYAASAEETLTLCGAQAF